jgi:hypothetical protein
LDIDNELTVFVVVELSFEDAGEWHPLLIWISCRSTRIINCIGKNKFSVQYVRSGSFEVSEIPFSVLIGSVSDFDVECKRVCRLIRLICE